MMQIGPMRVRVHDDWMIMRVAMGSLGRQAFVMMRVVSVVMPVRVLMPHGSVDMPMRVPLMHQQGDCAGEE